MSAFEQKSTGLGIFFHTRKMAGGNVFRPELAGAIDEIAELEPFVAHHAWIRRAASAVLLGEIIDDLFLELLRLVHEVVRNAQFVRNTSGIHHGLRPAAFVLRSGDTILRP